MKRASDDECGGNKRQLQQSLLPFCMQGKATPLAPPTSDSAHAIPAVEHVAASRMAAMYSVPSNSMSHEKLCRHKRNLTMIPIDNGYGGQTAVSFDAFVEEDGWLHVPRFYGVQIWGMPKEDNTTEGLPMEIRFNGRLNDVQTDATCTVIEKLQLAPHGAILVLPCGYGKTVCALYISHMLKRRTLVLVHKGFLVQQWHERAKTFLPDASLGIIQQNTVDADADIVVGMVQSLSKRNYSERILSQFGTVIIDEAHHMSAPVFSRALRSLPAKYILGLSATPERKDGMTCLLNYSMGDIAHRIERTPEHTLVSCILYEGGKRKEITYKDGRISMPLMLNAIVSDDARNNLIADQIKLYLTVGRFIIVLTDRICQLQRIMELLMQREVPASDISFYIGNTPADERQRATERPVILSTYAMAKEGLDIPRLDTLVMATPKGDIVQASGRVQRKHPEKKVPLIVDIVDTYSVFERLRWKRWNFYRNESFKCQTFGATNPDAPWFT